MDDPLDTGAAVVQLNGGMLARHPGADVLDVDNYLVHTQLESVLGHSGSPMYYCQSGGICTDNNTEELSAVLSGYINPPGLSNKAVVGVSTMTHHTWITNNL